VKNVFKKFALSAFAATLLATFVPAQQPLPSAPAPAGNSSTSLSAEQKNVEAFLRRYYALGTDVQVLVGQPKPIGDSGLRETTVEVKTTEGSDKVKMYLSKDGRYLIRGEVTDMSTDVLAETAAKIDTANSAVLGNLSAPITLVEFSDFECPVCRGLHDALRGLLPNYPQVRVIFKDFPIESLHPWARTAALAGRCAYAQDPKSFWKMYDFIYDNQDIISPSNAWDKMLDYAGQSGLNADSFKPCMASPQAAAEVDASLANGNLLEVHSTPTIFVNGRRVVGADPHAIQQYLDYEIAHLNDHKPSTQK
jgi:protein-disulfide isomerase